MYTLFIIYVLWQLQLIQDHVFSLLSVDDDLYLEYKINKIADMFNLFSTILTAWLVQVQDLFEFFILLGLYNFDNWLSRRVLSKLPTDNGAKVPFQHMPTNFIVKDKSDALIPFWSSLWIVLMPKPYL